MNYLKQKKALMNEQEVKEYLALFLSESERFNGTNLWLGNIFDDDLRVFFAHN